MKKNIYLYHVPRTGGTALHRALQKHETIKLTSSGHERWHYVDGYTVTMLRDPIDHINSLYDYIRNVKNHGEHIHARRCGTFAKWATTKGSTIGNFVKFFSRSVDLEEAKDNLSRIGFICLTDQLQNDFNLALKSFGIKVKIKIPRVNGTIAKTILTKSDIALVKELRSEDFKLYRWVLKVRDRMGI